MAYGWFKNKTQLVLHTPQHLPIVINLYILFYLYRKSNSEPGVSKDRKLASAWLLFISSSLLSLSIVQISVSCQASQNDSCFWKVWTRLGVRDWSKSLTFFRKILYSKEIWELAAGSSAPRQSHFHEEIPLREIIQQEFEAGASAVWFLRGNKKRL